MAKDRKKLIHMHSSVLDKQPTPASLEVGELAVNLSAGKEFISLKNSNNTVVRMSSDEQIVNLMEMKTVFPYSGTVENINLSTNRSNIEIKLNQVVADKTKFHEKVNGARDIDGDLINPTDDGGLTNGAGFKIDTSAFVLNGSNPSFSSMTSSCRTILEGTTEIKGLEGDCGSLLNVNVDAFNNSAKTASTNVMVSSATIGTGVTNITDSTENIGTENKTVTGNSVTTINGTTTIIREQDVTENNSANYNTTTIGDTTLTTNAACINARQTATFFGETKTNIGVDCDGVKKSNSTEVHGNKVSINSVSSVTVNSGDELCLASNTNANLYGQERTIIGISCGGDVTDETNIGGSIININGATNIEGDTNILGDTIVQNNLTVNGSTNLVNGLASSLEWKYDDVIAANSGKTNFSGSTISTITIPKDASHISRRELTIDYLGIDESMSGKADTTTYDPGSSVAATAYSPVYVSNLGRGTLKVEYKNSQCAMDSVSDVTYDPGSKYAFNGEVANTIYIPTSIEALDNACGSCVEINKDVCVSGSVSATGGIYQQSDEAVKENINYLGGIDMNKAKSIPFKTFNFKNDASKRKSYGVIAQDVEKAGLEELVHYNEKGIRSVDYTGLLILKIAELEYELKKITREFNDLKVKVKYK